MFYNIYQNSEVPNFTSYGILKMDFKLYPISSYIIPLDVIFKLIHATKNVPLIKYNPSKRSEKIYRLFTNSISTTGRKIPYLSRAQVFRLIKLIGKNKGVSCYIECPYKSSIIPIICEFQYDATISISLNLESPLNQEQLSNLIKANVNPIIKSLQKEFEQSGYNIPEFESFYNNNLQIEDIEYVYSLEIEKNLDIPSMIGCISSIFNVERSDLNKGIIMRYKRVSNYSEMDSQEAYILDLYSKDIDIEEVLERLKSTFQISEKSAREKVAETLRSVELIQSAHRSKSLKLRNNPGFLTQINQEKFKKVITISLSNINDINYLSVIPVYIYSLINLTQKKY